LENNFYFLEHKLLKTEEDRIKIIKNETNSLKNNTEKLNEFNEKFMNFEIKTINRLEYLEEKTKLFENKLSYKKENSIEIIEHTNKNHPEKLRIEFEKIEFRFNEILRNNRSNEDGKKTMNEIIEKLNKLELEYQIKFEE
jgi:hypothetical protein